MPLRQPMHMSNTAAGQWPAQAYLSQVRRLRQRYAGNPAMLQQAVGDLSRRRDAYLKDERKTAAPSPRAVRHIARQTYEPAGDRPTPFARAVVDWFANHVAGQLDDKLLHFSRRQQLLATANRLGIDRFHANLIIAVAQHHAPTPRASTTTILPARQGRALPIALALFVVQAAIAWGAWRVLHG